METFHYDNCGMVLFSKEPFFLSNLNKKCKTRSVTVDGWKMTIQSKDIKICPSTYWRTGRYDHQFEGYDFSCYLCGHNGTTPYPCKCKQYFTVEEHMENVKIARKNYLFAVVKSYFQESLSDVQKLCSSEEIVNKLLYKKGRYGEKILKVFYPPTFDYRDDYRTTKKIQKQLTKTINEIKRTISE
jgi:hypothetical protein